MTAATNIVIPDNKEIVQRSTSTSCRQYQLSTATSCLNARLVMGGPTDGDAIICTDENASALGFIVRDETLAAVRENDRTTAYSTNDVVAVCNGPGTKVVAYSEGAVTQGNKMVPGSSGAVKAFSSDAANIIVCKAEQTLTAAGFLVVTLLI